MMRKKNNRKFLIMLISLAGIFLMAIGILSFYNLKPKVGILYVATGKYIIFWDEFYQSAEKYLLPQADKTYYVWTDSKREFPKNVVKIPIKHPGWPEITLKRYHYFQQSWDRIKDNDYVFFFNANGVFKQKVGSEILPNRKQGIMVTLHPGFFNRDPKEYTYERRKESTAYIPQDQGKIYVVGGINGGTISAFKEMIDSIVKKVDIDSKRGIVAVYHGESHLNKYILHKNPLILSPEYAYPEDGETWKNLKGLSPKYLLKDKNKYGGHKYLRGLSPKYLLKDKNKYGGHKYLRGNKTYVIDSAYGGLGNRMFKYAASLAYAKRHHLKACYNSDSYRDIFKNLLPKCTEDDLASRIPLHRCPETLDSVMNDNKCSDIKGYNQNPLLFMDYEQDIKNAFIFPNVEQKNQKLKEKIETTNSISLHFRRGDYITTGYPILELSYYENAIEYIVQKTKKKPHLFIFTNDVEWVEENFTSKYPFTIVRGNSGPEDMHLMSLCHHQVIANSTFSWWAAYLNKNPTKIIVAPDTWDARHPNWGKTIIPAEWKVIHAPALIYRKPNVIDKKIK